MLGDKKFHVWIPHGNIADIYLFSCPNCVLFWSYVPLKNQNEMLSARYLEKLFELGA